MDPELLAAQAADAQNSSAPAPAPAADDPMLELDAKIADGYDPSDAELEAYAAWVEGGKQPAPAEPAEPVEPAQSEPPPDAQPPVSQQQDERTAQALAIADALPQFLAQLKSGDPNAIAAYRQLTGQDYHVPAAPAAPAAPASTTATQTNDAGIDQFLLPQETIDASVAPELGQAYNERIKALVGTFQGQLQELQAKILDQVRPAIENAKTAKESAALAKVQSQIIDEMKEIAETYADDYGLAGIPVRELVAAYVTNKDKGAQPDPRLGELLATVKYMVDNEISNLQQAHKLRFFDKLPEKFARQKIAAARGQDGNQAAAASAVSQASPASGQGPTIAELEAGASMPDEWLDEDMMPNQAAMPPEIYSYLTTGKQT
jgi:hypothetical protein